MEVVGAVVKVIENDDNADQDLKKKKKIDPYKYLITSRIVDEEHDSLVFSTGESFLFL